MVKMENGLPETNTAEEAGQQVAGQPSRPVGPRHG